MSDEVTEDRQSLVGLYGVGLAAVIYSAGDPRIPWHPWDSIVGLLLLFMVLSLKRPRRLFPLLAYAGILAISAITAAGVLIEWSFGQSDLMARPIADFCPDYFSKADCAFVTRWDLFYFALWLSLTAAVAGLTLLRRGESSTADAPPGTPPT